MIVALPKMAGMETVFLEAGHVMAMLTVILELMKLIVVLLQHVTSKVFGTVAMDSVLILAMFAMVQLQLVMQVGVQIVLMVQMKA